MSIKILVVDDSPTDRLIIQKMLIDYDVLMANDEVEAMSMLKQYPTINLMILDLNMPNMGGFQVLEALKQDKKYKNIRVIILTNYDEVENEIKGLKLGAVDYIRKPINLDSLRARIDVHLELLRIQDLQNQKFFQQGITYDTIFQQAPIGIAISYSDIPFDIGKNTFSVINSTFEQITGRNKEQLKKMTLKKLVHPDDYQQDLMLFEKILSGEKRRFSLEQRFIRPDGSIVWARLIVARLVLETGNNNNYIFLLRDVTARKEFEKALIESERSKTVLLSNLPGMAYRCSYDHNWTMQFVSNGCYKLTGYNPETFIDNREKAFNDIISPEYREALWEEWQSILNDKRSFKFEYEITTATGEKKWVLEYGQGVYKEDGQVEALEGIILDITDRKEMENHLRYLSIHDNFTGLYNRAYFDMTLERDIVEKEDVKKSLIIVNLSTTHVLTANHGYNYTLKVIKKTAECLERFTNENCDLFIAFENRFLFYIRNYETKDDLINFAQAVAEELDQFLKLERIGAGIGIMELNHYQKANIDRISKLLLIASEKAMNGFGKDIGICLVDEKLEAMVERESEIRKELMRIAQDNNSKHELFLTFQPILDLPTEKISGFEALARLKTEKLGIVSPTEFIPIAEKSKLIVPLGDIIIIEAFNFANRLRESGFDSVSVAINVSAIQLLKIGFNERLLDLVKTMRINPSKIVLEITESVLAQDYGVINSIIRELKGAGFVIAIDDFGTGYSSLAREKELDVDCLKIDKFFVDHLLYDLPEKAITGDIISMAHRIGQYTVAEGVETESQKQYLKVHNCDKIQGYLISRPIPPDDAIALLKEPKIG